MKSIIFNTEMVKAVLDGRQTQVRESFSKKQLKYFDYAQKLGEISNLDNLHKNDFSYILQFSKYKVDDILYVKETFGEYYQMCNHGNFCDCEPEIIYKSGKNYPYDTDCIKKWKPSIHMPKEYARIFLKVTNVRVEKIQDISLEDMLKEGINHKKSYNYGDIVKTYTQVKREFINNWNSTAKDGCKWEDNPYVFAYEFEKINKED